MRIFSTISLYVDEFSVLSCLFGMINDALKNWTTWKKNVFENLYIIRSFLLELLKRGSKCVLQPMVRCTA